MKTSDRIKKLADKNLPEYTPEEVKVLNKIEALKRMAINKPDIAADIAEKESNIMEMVDKSEKRGIMKDKIMSMMKDRREIEDGKNPIDIGSEMRKRRVRRMMQKESRNDQKGTEK